jgi:hypothetical protein
MGERGASHGEWQSLAIVQDDSNAVDKLSACIADSILLLGFQADCAVCNNFSENVLARENGRDMLLIIFQATGEDFVGRVRRVNEL